MEGLFASRGFLMIGDSLYGRIGRWDGRRFNADVDAGGYDFAEFGEYVYASAYAGVFRDGIRRGGSTGAGICGLLFMGYNNGRLERCWRSARVLVFKAPDSIEHGLPTAFIWWRCCGVWGSFMGYRLCMSTTGRTCFSVGTR